MLALLGFIIAIGMLWITADLMYGIVALFFVGMMICTTVAAAPVFRGGGDNWVDKLVLIDPRFNLREVAKQMILLEDHLFHKNKHCRDCISKHTLYIEGLLEEALTMDTEQKYAPIITSTLSQFKELLPPLVGKLRDKTATEQDYTTTALALRGIRKPIAVEFSYYDI